MQNRIEMKARAMAISNELHTMAEERRAAALREAKLQDEFRDLARRLDWFQGSNIEVKLDGDAWCATGPGFVDLQESAAGFGRTPSEAVEQLRAQG